MSRACLIVPPLLKYAAGPLLGPALLAGAGRAAGHDVEILDLNARYLAQRLRGAVSSTGLTGDHDKPVERLRAIAATERERIARSIGVAPRVSSRLTDPVFDACFAVDDLLRAADGLRGEVERELTRVAAPDIVGISILFGGQLVWAIAVAKVARAMWPQARIVWGGPHVSAVAESLARLPQLRSVCDAFVVGYAERTFVELLDFARDADRQPAAANIPGAGLVTTALDDASSVPVFDDLSNYGTPRVTLPAQFSRGCAYGRCSFCTYPAIEGRYRPLDIAPVSYVIDTAARTGAAVSFKDSLVLPDRLVAIADLVRGRAPWSACTKLHGRLVEIAPALARAGCRTLEVGLETLVADTQLAIEKRQRPELFERVLHACAAADIRLVVNYMTGFPYEDAGAAARALEDVRTLAERHGATIEHNVFQLERLAPIVSTVRVTRSWPLASVLDWEPRAGKLHVVAA